jgi:hypothetical protein
MQCCVCRIYLTLVCRYNCAVALTDNYHMNVLLSVTIVYDNLTQVLHLQGQLLGMPPCYH